MMSLQIFASNCNVLRCWLQLCSLCSGIVPVCCLQYVIFVSCVSAAAALLHSFLEFFGVFFCVASDGVVAWVGLGSFCYIYLDSLYGSTLGFGIVCYHTLVSLELFLFSGAGGWALHLCLGFYSLHLKYHIIPLLILVGIPPFENVILT